MDVDLVFPPLLSLQFTGAEPWADWEVVKRVAKKDMISSMVVGRSVFKCWGAKATIETSMVDRRAM